MNLWKDIEIGRRPPEEVSVVIEVPKGSRNKYEYNRKWKAIHLERVLLAPLRCPGEYGFIPQTCCNDKDPLEAIVVIDEPTYPGCIVDVRPVGLLNMLDSGKADDKVLCVLINDPKYADYSELGDVETHILEEVAHFFEVYKRLEGKETTVVGWDEADVAKERIQYAMDLFKRMTDV
jgi:inorganic pyrophosphatase